MRGALLMSAAIALTGFQVTATPIGLKREEFNVTRETIESFLTASLLDTLFHDDATKLDDIVKRDVMEGDETSTLVQRSNLPFLDTILVFLKNSGLVNTIIELVLLNPELEKISAEATILLLKSGQVNLADVFIALNKSGLALQTIELALDDPQILPGLLRIGSELLKQNGIGILQKRSDALDDNVLDKRETEDAARDTTRSLTKRESQLLNDIFAALKDSGLAESVIQNLLTNPELAAPAAHFLSDILKSHAITLSELLTALKESNFALELLKQILGDKKVLERFGSLILDRVANGKIPEELLGLLN